MSITFSPFHSGLAKSGVNVKVKVRGNLLRSFTPLLTGVSLIYYLTGVPTFREGISYSRNVGTEGVPHPFRHQTLGSSGSIKKWRKHQRVGENIEKKFSLKVFKIYFQNKIIKIK